MRQNRIAIVIATLALTLASVGLPAAASAAAAPPVACTAYLQASGKCLTAVTIGSESPLVAGAMQAAQRGDLASLRLFVKNRAKSTRDAAQTSIERIASVNSAVAGPAMASAERATDAQAEATTSGYPGTIVGPTLDLVAPVSYQYCSSSCTIVGTLKVEFRYTINGNIDFTSSGDVDVKTGPPVDFTKIECLTYFEGFPFDQVVKTWSNCPSADGNGYKKAAIVVSQRWADGSLGETYHPDYTVEFRPGVSSAPIFSEHYRVKSYHIDKNGHTHWLP